VSNQPIKNISKPIGAARNLYRLSVRTGCFQPIRNGKVIQLKAMQNKLLNKKLKTRLQKLLIL
jgi:hypothetical protein